MGFWKNNPKLAVQNTIIGGWVDKPGFLNYNKPIPKQILILKHGSMPFLGMRWLLFSMHLTMGKRTSELRFLNFPITRRVTRALLPTYKICAGKAERKGL